jgi:arylsulfatase A-like enzyme
MKLRYFFSIVIFFIFSVYHSSGQEIDGGDTHPNVLFIAIDDMNDWAGFLNTHPQVRTPNIDALAEEGIFFTNAHCPAPICGPSRTAILSGLWPTSNGIYSNDVNYRRQLPHLVSLPEHFRQNGYHVMGVGKIFHSGVDKMPEGAFDEYGGKGGSGAPFTGKELSVQAQTPFNRVIKHGKEFMLPLNGIPPDRYWNTSHTFDWGAVDLPDSLFADTRTANWAINKLNQKQGKPFFLAVGFARPHQPMFNPKRYHDLYPLNSVVLPPTIEHDLADVPRAGREYALVAATSGLHKSVEQYGEWEHAVSSYLAAISYVDDLVGNIIQALKKSAYAENTLIVLWSDHGWHLGEKEHWGKATGWLRSTRVPMLIVPPKNDIPAGFRPNRSNERVVNLLDLAPTIADMSNIPILETWEGNSLLPLIKNPTLDWQEYTHTTFGLGNHTVSTVRWQFIHYFDGTSELYDIQRDPDEFVNLTNDKKYEKVKMHLQQYLPEEPQWKYFVRYNNFKAVIPTEGSNTLLFNLVYRNQVNEQVNVAADYPEIVKKIVKWLAQERPTSKFLWMEE